MLRINICLSAEVQKRLGEYRKRELGNHHSVAAIVKKAIKEFLDREENQTVKIEKAYGNRSF